MTDGPGRSDSELLRLLGDALSESDPVPEEVSEFGRSTWTWPPIDSAHASLIFDSILEEPVAVRSDTNLRALSFAGADFLVEAEHDPSEGTLMGRIDPAGRYGIEFWAGESRIAGETDERGRFLITPVAGGPVRLIVSRPDGEPLLKTEWVNLSTD